jgi:hypothetical protein
VNGQLQLFAEPKPKPKKKGGSVGCGPRGLLRRLIETGLDPDATVAAARLVALLDEDAGAARR